MNPTLGLCCLAALTLLCLPGCIDTGCEKTLTCPVSAASSGTGASAGQTGAAGENAGGTGGVPPGCGNGMVEPPAEQCDDGPMNGPGQACKANCTLNFCGDADQGPDEGCDEGSLNNGVALGLCAPDCSHVIEKKHIIVSSTYEPDANIAPNVVSVADSHCPTGYKALIAYGGQRRATTIGYTVANPIDWVLQPYTYYFNNQENPVWLTKEVALLGIENGQFMDLENTIWGMVTSFQITGLNPDWTTLGILNCSGWTSAAPVEGRFGAAFGIDSWAIYYDDQPIACSDEKGFYCVEQ